MFPEKKVRDILIFSQILPEAEFLKAKEKAKKEKKDILQYLFDNGIIKPDIFYSACATFLNLPFVDLKSFL